jgi:hypothetical protein
MIEEIINASELQILMNILGKEIEITFPLYYFKLLRGIQRGDGYELEVICDKSDFEREAAKFNEFASEMPSYNDYLSCLLSSGILQYKNIDKFKEKLRSYRELKKKVYFSLDTNMLYQRFLSVYNLISPSEVILVDTVIKEIKASLNYKYSPRQITEMKRMIPHQKNLFNEFVNRKVKKSRYVAYLAMREYKSIMAHALELKSIVESSVNKEENDRIIVKTLKGYEEERHVLPVLLTADNGMADLCEIEGIEHFLFEVPHVIDADYCSSECLLDFIFNLAAVFGVIKLNSVIVYGEFKGKSSNKPSELKLIFLDEKIGEIFGRDLRICRKLMEIGIENKSPICN